MISSKPEVSHWDWLLFGLRLLILPLEPLRSSEMPKVHLRVISLARGEIRHTKMADTTTTKPCQQTSTRIEDERATGGAG
jgi:hypothetical protein